MQYLLAAAAAHRCWGLLMRVHFEKCFHAWLQDSLSGNSKTLMFVNVNPTEADAGETACSLQFATRVRGVELGAAKRNVEAGGEISQLRAELEAVRQQVGRPVRHKQHMDDNSAAWCLSLLSIAAKAQGSRRLPSPG